MTKHQKFMIEKWALRSVAELLEDDHGDPFKDRWNDPPDGFDDGDVTDDGDVLINEADDYFFKCIAKLAKRLGKEGKV